MYYICKFSGTWSLYDGLKGSSRILETSSVECLKTLFSGLVGDSSKMLIALQVSAIAPNKLLQAGASPGQALDKKPLYYICKFSGTWSIYDGTEGTSRLLAGTEVDCLKSLFAGLLGDDSKMLVALQVMTIAPNKLLQVTTPESKPIITKTNAVAGKA